jgi:hypothetical protein
MLGPSLLAVGDYILAVAGQESRIVVPFKVKGAEELGERITLRLTVARSRPCSRTP